MFCNLVVPLLMIGVGRMMMKHPPKTINMVFGYRTSRSMKNQEAWDFAQVYCRKLWWKIGWIMLPTLIVERAIAKTFRIYGMDIFSRKGIDKKVWKIKKLCPV